MRGLLVREGRGQELRPGLGGSLAGPAGSGRSEDGKRRGLLARFGRGDGGERPEALTTRWSSGNRWATRVAGVAIVGLLLAGPAHVVHDLVVDDAVAPVATRSAGDDQRMLSRRLVASESALQWVQAWAGASESDRAALGELYGGPLSLPKKPSKVSEARVVDAQASGPGVWSVMVTAVVTDPGGKPARRYFSVPVQVQGDTPGQVSAAPQAVPAVVPGPPVMSNADSGSYGATLSSTSPAGQTIGQFLGALLTGQGQVDRYVTPGSTITALPESSQYAVVRVVTIRTAAGGDVDWLNTPADGQVAEVLVDATVGASSQPGDQRSVTYPLQLTSRGGRWEISAIQPRLATTSAPSGAQENTGGSATDTEGENQ